MTLETVITYKNELVDRFPHDIEEIPYLGGRSIEDVVAYFIQDGDNIAFGVDVLHRTFIISGVILHTYLPEGDYQLIAFKRNQENSLGEHRHFYCFGLKANIEGKVHQLIMLADAQTGAYSITNKI